MKNLFILIVLLVLLSGSTPIKESSATQRKVYHQEFTIDGVKYYWVYTANNWQSGEVICPASDKAMIHSAQIAIRGSKISFEKQRKMVNDIIE